MVDASFKQGMHSRFATVPSTPSPNTPYCSDSELISLENCTSHQVPVESGAAGPGTTLGELLPDCVLDMKIENQLPFLIKLTLCFPFYLAHFLHFMPLPWAC